MARILGISGSPKKMGNIEKAMVHVMQSSGADFEMVRLSQLRLTPCVACLKCCESNRCVQQDDMNRILGKIEESSAVVIGAFPTFMSVNGLTKTFTERMYPLKHRKMITKGKLGVVVAGGFRDAHVVESYLSSFLKWFQMEVVGSVRVGGNPPCLFCGYGESCDYSNVPILYGKGASINEKMIYSFDGDDESRRQAFLLGERLGLRLKEKEA